MADPWIERFWKFVCRVFGHQFLPNSGWQHAGKLHATCQRCKRILSEDPAHG